MNDYTVTLIYDQFSITTVVYCNDRKGARRLALSKLNQDEGLSIGEPMEYQIELEGTYDQ